MKHIPQVESGPRQLSTMRVLAWLLCTLAALLLAPSSRADTYTLPSAFGTAPFSSCTLKNGTYECGSITLDKDSVLSLTSNVSIWVKGSFSAQKSFSSINNGHTLYMAVDSTFTTAKDTSVTMDIVASGKVSLAKNANIKGNITSSGGVDFAKDSTVTGNLIVSGNVTASKNVVINGSCTITGTKPSGLTCTGGTIALHHLRATRPSTGSTCAAMPVVITACSSADSNGSCTAYTGGVSGTLVAEDDFDGTLSSVNFSIGSGSSSATVSLPAITTAQIASLTFDNVSKTSATQGTCWDGSSSSSCDVEITDCAAHHVRLDHTGSGVTCSPSSITVNACKGADASGSCTAYTSGMSGTVVALSSTGTQVGSVPFTITSPASSTTVSLPVTSAQTVTLGTSGLSPSAANASTCWNTTSSSASCSHGFSDSALQFSISDHVSDVTQSAVTLKAVRQSGSTTACTSALANGTYSIAFGCTYNNPAGGSQKPRITSNGVTVTPTCGASTSALNLAFTNGSASFDLRYADAGQVTLSATYAGAPTMTGSDTFIAVPAKFTITNVTAAPIKAGNTFTARVQAVNASGGITPSFGLESTKYKPVLTYAKCQPTFSGAAAGVLGGGTTSTYNGAPSYNFSFNALSYSEVGTGDLVASLAYDADSSAAASYLGATSSAGSLLTIAGTTNTSGTCGAVGRFTPAYFETSVPATLKYTYSGQPITSVTITPKSATGGTIYNYNGGPSATTFAKAITLTAVDSAGTAIAGTVGSISAGGTVAATSFVDGTTSATATPTFKFVDVTGGINGTKPSPKTVYLRATDADSITSSGHETAGGAVIRLGRLRLFSATGNATAALKVWLQTEYWSGKSWLINTDDNSTALPSNAIALSPSYSGFSRSVTGGTSQVTSGKGSFTFSNPSGTATKGYIDVAINLGSTTTDASCLGTHPSTTGANLSWLRSLNGVNTTTCAAGTYDKDPSARASFGVYSTDERKSVIHVREVFN